MWTRLIFVALVAASAVQAWTPNTEYTYKVKSRTLSALHQVGDQYSGMLTRATLTLYATSENRLYAKISEPEYADVHQYLPGGWGAPIDERSLEWHKLDMTDRHFTIHLRNGVVDRFKVSPKMPEWEINMIKALVSQLQVDSRAENFINSRINQLPSDDSDNAVYKTMEDSVTGKCEVLYDISPLPEYILQSHPQLVPKPSRNPEEAKILDIVKSTNYSNCEQRPVFHHGFGGENDWEAGSSKMGQFLARSSVSRVVVTGTPKNNLIQSSVTTNKVILSPAVYNNQKGMVVSRMNLTLLAAHSSDAMQRFEASEQPSLEIRDLVYDIAHPDARHNQPDRNSGDDQSTEQGESKENIERMQGAAAQRFRRSLKPSQQEQQEQRKRDQKQNQESNASYESESSEDNSMSNEDWTMEHPNMNDAPEIPFLPFFIGNKGKSIQGKVDVPQKAAEMAREIAKEFQKPRDVPQKATLAKFTILTRLVQTMSSEHLQKVSEELYTSEQYSKEAKAWKVYRDAVNQAGTAPALVTMKQWIESRKVQGEDAAEMVAQIPNVALIPNKQYVHLFYKLATSEVVKSQRHLNTTAILSFTDLVRKAQVDQRFAHNSYPTHTYGRMNPTNVPAVTRDYIPYLAYQFLKAVRDGDSVRIQTYVRALGNVAHPKILSILKPYLEGEKQVSDFQRLHMVISLNKLRKVQPALARAVFYRIYKNKSETPEIRSAAVYLMMKTNPQASMLQRMAESTKDEHSKQVRTAVKTAIESASQSWQSWQTADNAQAAVNALNNTDFGPEYSRIKLGSGKVPEMNIAYLAGASAIGSDDYFAPKAIFAHFQQILAALKLESHSAGYMASSTKDLFNLIKAQSGKAYTHPDKMDIQREFAQQVEGNFYGKSVFGQRFFAFDNHTIERIPEVLEDMLHKLSQGQNFAFQKMYNKKAFTLAFPTATGLPFIYSLRKPTVASFEAKVQAEIQPEISSQWKSAKATAEIKMFYSSKSEGVIGFVAPFNGKLYIAGTEKDVQLNLPVRAELQFDSPSEGSETKQHSMRLKLQPLKPEEDSQIAIYRSKPYTSQVRIADLKPAQMKTIHVNKPKQMKFVVGRETTGMAFRLEVYSEHEHFDYAEILRQIQKKDTLQAFASATEEKKINKYEYTVTYDHDMSHSKAVLLTATYAALDKKKESDPDGYKDSARTQSKGGNDEEDVFDDNQAIPTNAAPASSDRLQQFLHRVSATMKASRASAIDLSAQFKGERDAVYIATIAGAKSPMEDRYAALVYLRHACVNGEKNAIAMFPCVHIPFYPVANYERAINNKPTAYVETKITFGDDLEQSHSQIHIKTTMERSAEREQYVREQPISALCKQQAGHGNNYLPACQNATTAAGHMDHYQVTVKYARVPESVKNATYKAYSLARHVGWEYHSEDLISANNEPRKINLNFRFAPNLQSANASLHAPKMNAQFKNVRLSRAVSAAVVAHPNYKPTELFSTYIYGKSYNPVCTVDKSAVNTFNNKTFALPLEEEWYLVAEYVPKQYLHAKHSPAKQIPYIKIQTRQSRTSQKEIKMSFGTKDVVEIFPRGSEEYPEIKVNKELYNTDSSMPWSEVESKVDNRVFIRFYRLPSGTTKLVAPRYDLEMVYDSTTFALKVGNQYRGDLRGLCGTFDGETETDFTTPKKCIARDSRLFVKSYIVSGDGNIKYPEFASQPRDCIYKKFAHTNVISDYEAGREQGSLYKAAKDRRCTSFRTKVVEQEGNLCFSVRPLPACSSHCQPSSQNEQNVGFHCMADSSAARHYAKLALKGVSLDIASKGANKNFAVKVPESCQA